MSDILTDTKNAALSGLLGDVKIRVELVRDSCGRARDLRITVIKGTMIDSVNTVSLPAEIKAIDLIKEL